MTDHRLLHPITHSTPSSTQPSLVPAAPAAPPTARPALEEASYLLPTGIVVPDPSRAIVPVPSARRAPDVVPGGYPLWELPAPLRRLCESLEAATEEGAIPLEVMRDQLERLENNLQMLAPWWMFDACTYRRNLIRRTATYEALLLCWLPGQRSPIHDHRGSGCAFRVIEGVVTETLYEPTKSGLVTAASMRWLPPGTICASREFDVHEVANTQLKADLVTLHIYSPPLRDVNLYRAADATPIS